MATLGLSLGLGALGAFSGVAGLAEVGFLGGQLIGNAFFGRDEKTVINEGPRVTDLRLSSSALGAPIPWVFGSQRLGTQMIDGEDINETRIVTEQEVGGKGGGGSTVQNITYTYDVNAAFLACRGPKTIVKVWADDKLIYDVTGTDTPAFANKFRGHMRFYTGSTTQLPDPLLEEIHGVGNTPAYRNFCYFVIEEFPLADFGNRVPQFNVLVADATPTLPFDTQTPFHDVGTGVADKLSDFRFVIDRDGDVMDVVPVPRPIVRKVGTVDSASVQDDAGNIWQPIGFLDGDFVVQDRDGILIVDTRIGKGFVNLVDPSNTEFEVFPGPDTPRWLNVVSVSNPALSIVFTARCCFCGIQGILNWVDLDYKIDPDTGEGSWTATYFLRQVLADMGINPPTGISAFDNNTEGFSCVDGDGNFWFTYGHDSNEGLSLIGIDPFTFEVFHNEFLGSGEEGLMTCDKSLNRIFLVHGNTAKVFDIETGVTTTLLTPVLFNDIDHAMNFKAGPTEDHKFYHLGTIGGNFYEFDLKNLTFTAYDLKDWDTPGSGYPTQDYDRFYYDRVSNAFVTGDVAIDPRNTWHYFGRVTTAGTNLKAIVDAISQEVGLVPGVDISTDPLAVQLVHGFAINGVMEARNAIDVLRAAYDFDAVESDWIIKFNFVNGASVRTLTEDDLGFKEGEEGLEDFVEETFGSHTNIPVQYIVNFVSQEIDYQSMTARFRRGDGVTTSQNKQKLDLPIVMTALEGKQIAERKVIREILDKDIKRFTCSWKNIDLDATDVVTIQLNDGTDFDVFIKEATIGDDGTVEFSGVLSDFDIQTSFLDSIDVQASDGFTQQQIAIGSNTQFHIIDSPAFRDKDVLRETPIVYSAAGGYGDDPWGGAQIQRSKDTGITWQNHTTITESLESIWGSAATALSDTTPPGKWTVWDRVNTVDVIMASGTLSSSTESAVLDGANAMLLGNEVIQFVNATLNADGSYTLDTLLRGRRGTEWAMGSHGGKERAVLLFANGLSADQFPVEELDIGMYWRAVGLDDSHVERRINTIVGRSIMPLAPMSVRGSRSGLNVATTWQRRTRSGGAIDWNAGPSAPLLYEDKEEYEIDIFDDADTAGATVLGTLAGITSESRTITEEELQSALGSAFDPANDYFRVRVYQVNSVAGRGFSSPVTRLPNQGIPVTEVELS